MLTDRWTDMTKVTITFNNVAKAPRNVVRWTRASVSADMYQCLSGHVPLSQWTCTSVSADMYQCLSGHIASTLESEYTNSTLHQQSATYAHTKPYTDQIFKVSHHFRLAQQYWPSDFLGCNTVSPVKCFPTFHSNTVPSSSEAFWWHSDTSQKTWNLSHHCNKQTNTKHDLWWHRFGILSPVRCHEGTETSITTSWRSSQRFT